MDSIMYQWSVQCGKGEMSVLPDGCRDLIAISSQGGPVSFVCTGLDASPRHVVCEGETRFVGIRLAPGVSFPWERAESSVKYSDQPLLDAAARLDHEAEPADMQQCLLDVMEYAQLPPQWLADCLQELNEGRSISHPRSERSIRRGVLDLTGASPRFWKGLGRVRRAGLAIVQSDLPLADIALAHGYADQAHLCRDVRRLLGVTPARLRQQPEAEWIGLASPDAFSIIANRQE